MQNKTLWKILAILFVFLMVASCATPSIAVDDNSLDNALNPLNGVFPPENINYISDYPFSHPWIPADMPFDLGRGYAERDSEFTGFEENLSRVKRYSKNVSLSSNTYYVPDNFTKIQWAVDNASAGDTIIARDGTYTENVDVNVNNLTIKSENGSTSTIVQAANSNDHVFYVTADYVNISGFTVAGATVYRRAGIYLYNAEHCNISDNTASNNCDGIRLPSSNNNTLTNNTANSNIYYGIYLWSSSNNVLTNNTASNNLDGGIYLYGSSNNELTNNSASNNYFDGIGIILLYSSNNTLRNNTMSGNDYNFGVYGGSLSDYIQNIGPSNTVDGKPIYYWVNQRDREIADDAGYVGIINSTNITVGELTLTNNYEGVLLAYTSNSRIENINASNNGYSIYMLWSNNNLITNNSASNNYHGIYLYGSSNNELTNNSASNNYYGICLGSSSNSTLSNNVISDNNCNFDVWGSSLSHYIQNIDTTNKVDGKPVYYWINQQNQQIPNDAGYVGVVNSTNITVRDLAFQGVLFAYTSNSRIENVNISNNIRGIFLDHSNNNTLINNDVLSFVGIYLFYSDNNTLTNNTASNNRFGIRLYYSNNNIIYMNNFIDVTYSVYSFISTNIWNSTEIITYTYNSSEFENYLGNYWDDYKGNDTDGDGIGDTPYPVDGDNDNYPLMERFENYALKENHRPIANAGGPYYGNINEPIQFLGKGTDPDGDAIIAYAWDFDNDGITDSTLQNPTHSWAVAGTYYPTLKVKDSKGVESGLRGCTVYVFEPFTFVQVTDVHIGWDQKSINHEKDMKQSVERFTEIIQIINDMSPKPKFVLITGDLVEWNKPDFFYKFMDALANLDLKHILFYHIPGNHDRRTLTFEDDNLKNYHDCIKVNGPRLVRIAPDNYTFEYGGYLFVGLDSGKDSSLWIPPLGSGLDNTQMTQLWGLDKDKPKIIFMHHPAINDRDDPNGGDGAPGGNEGCIADNRYNFIHYTVTRKNMNNVQLVLTGHTHQDKIFNAIGERVDVDSNDRPLFIQTRSATKEEFGYGFRRVRLDASGAYPYPSEPSLKFIKRMVWVSGLGNMVLHAYDSEGRHTGVDENGNVVREIPETYYIGNYEGNLEGIIFYNTEEDYKLTVTLKDGSIVPQTEKLQQPENQSFHLTITNQTDDSLIMISYNNVNFTKNTTATVHLNRTAANYTMAIDYTGDNITDETKDPDSIETDYAPTATINTRVNNSIYHYGDQILFNGTGIDIENGILTNSSLVWSSNRDGFIGIGCECNTTNLTAGTHIIELTVNDSSGQTDTDNVTITLMAPDLAVSIAFSNQQPIEGENILINATVHNTGTANATNVTVQLFDGNPVNSTQIGANQTIASISAGKNKTVSVVWDTTGEAGDNRIWVVVDPSDSIKESDEGNNQANKSIFVGAPNVLHILQAQTDRAVYLGNEEVLIACIVQNASGNISANVSADIEKPDGFMDNITLTEGLIGNYNGTFTNTSLSGTYNITIYANRTGFIDDNESLSFEVLDTTPPASITNITNTTGSTWINWTWDNPGDPDFEHTLIYLNGTWKTATSKSYYLAEGLNASTEYEIETRTVDTEGNINETGVSQTAKTGENETTITFFGTGKGTYPSIMGNHTGTIKPNHTVIATELYTYPCTGTGGHTEYARILNLTWNATAIWKGYVEDWHNITFDKTVVLLENKTYNYTIRTGSYPQIHHNASLLTKNGWINCTQFVDVNGKEYDNWIPAIKLE